MSKPVKSMISSIPADNEQIDRLEHELAGQEAEDGMSNLKLTLQEAQCIAQFINKKSLVQIAIELGIKERTVYFYLISTQRKIASLAKQIAVTLNQI